MTDGSIYLTTRNRGHISIELGANDIELLKKIQEKIPDSKLNTRIRNTNFKENYQTATWSDYQKEFREKFFSYGMPKKDKGIYGTVPIVKYSENDFWRGVIDGNGSIGFTSDGDPFISLTTASKILKENLCELLYKNFNIKKNIKPNKRDNVYNIVLKCEDAIAFCDFLYKNAEIYLQRKYIKYIEIKKWKRTKKKIYSQSWTSEEIEFIKTHNVKESMIHLQRTEKSIKMKLWRVKQNNL